jgi:hypothetical protein
MLPVGLPTPLSPGSKINLQFTGTETNSVYLKGEVNGTEVFETVTVTGATPATTTNYYDTVLALTKPTTTYSLNVMDTSNNVIMALGPGEHERRHQRIQLYPTFDASFDQTVFVLGKRRLPQMMDDGDTCLLRGFENVLIFLTASDILTKMGKGEQATPIAQKAQLLLQTLIDREIKEATYQPRVVPYVEPDAFIIGDIPAFLKTW